MTLPLKKNINERYVSLFSPPSFPKIFLFLLILGIFAGVLSWMYQKDGSIIVEDACLQSEEVFVSTDISGKVSQLVVHTGEYVNVGDLLFSIDVEDVEAEIQLKNAELQKIYSILQNVKKESERAMNEYFQAKQSVEVGLISSLEMEEKMKNFQEFEKKVSLLNSDLNIQQKLLDRLTLKKRKASVRALTSGVVSDLSSQIGSFVKTDQAIITIRNLQNLWIEGYILEKFCANVYLNDPVSIHISSYPDVIFTGKVSQKDTKVDEQGRLKLFFSLDSCQQEYYLMPGMRAKVLFLNKKNKI